MEGVFSPPSGRARSVRETSLQHRDGGDEASHGRGQKEEHLAGDRRARTWRVGWEEDKGYRGEQDEQIDSDRKNRRPRSALTPEPRRCSEERSKRHKHHGVDAKREASEVQAPLVRRAVQRAKEIVEVSRKERREEGDHAKGLGREHKPGGTEKGWRWRAGHPPHVIHGTMLGRERASPCAY